VILEHAKFQPFNAREIFSNYGLNERRN